MEQRDKRILEKIIMYCRRISENLSRCKHDYTVFSQDHMLQDACCMCVVQIGELVGQLSDETKQRNQSIPWRAIKDTRNFYVHAYGSIDLKVIWATLLEDIPVLQEACKALIL